MGCRHESKTVKDQQKKQDHRNTKASGNLLIAEQLFLSTKIGDIKFSQHVVKRQKSNRIIITNSVESRQFFSLPKFFPSISINFGQTSETLGKNPAFCPRQLFLLSIIRYFSFNRSKSKLFITDITVLKIFSESTRRIPS